MLQKALVWKRQNGSCYQHTASHRRKGQHHAPQCLSIWENHFASFVPSVPCLSWAQRRVSVRTFGLPVLPNQSSSLPHAQSKQKPRCTSLKHQTKNIYGAWVVNFPYCHIFLTSLPAEDLCEFNGLQPSLRDGQ